jgi:hypothetical protein
MICGIKGLKSRCLFTCGPCNDPAWLNRATFTSIHPHTNQDYASQAEANDKLYEVIVDS